MSDAGLGGQEEKEQKTEAVDAVVDDEAPADATADELPAEATVEEELQGTEAEPSPPEPPPPPVSRSSVEPLPEEAAPSTQASPPPPDVIPDYDKMTTLAEFGYAFNAAGELRSVEGGRPFEFEVHGKGKTSANQRRYEALGEVLTLHIFGLLELAGLVRKYIPVDASPKDPRSFVFASRNAAEADSLLILIHGTGVVRAGQWARRLLINANLDSGTQLPYIRRAVERGWGVLVLNTNYVRDPTRGNLRVARVGSPDAHGVYAWDHFVKDAKAAKIAIVAHSAGGWVTGHIARENRRDFNTRVKAIAFTDSFCEPSPHITKVGRNWVTSRKELDTALGSDGSSRVAEFSAGTLAHEETSHAAIEPIWAFFDEMMGTQKLDEDSKVKESKIVDGTKVVDESKVVEESKKRKAPSESAAAKRRDDGDL